MARKKRNVGSDFDDFLADEGILEQTTAIAIKRVIAWQIQATMKAQGITKRALAARMKTSRSSLDRLLDEDDTGLTLETLTRAARALGCRVRVELADEEVMMTTQRLASATHIRSDYRPRGVGEGGDVAVAVSGGVAMGKREYAKVMQGVRNMSAHLSVSTLVESRSLCYVESHEVFSSRYLGAASARAHSARRGDLGQHRGMPRTNRTLR